MNTAVLIYLMQNILIYTCKLPFNSLPYIQIKLPHLSYYTIYTLPSGTKHNISPRPTVLPPSTTLPIPNFTTAALSQMSVHLIYLEATSLKQLIRSIQSDLTFFWIMRL